MGLNGDLSIITMLKINTFVVNKYPKVWTGVLQSANHGTQYSNCKIPLAFKNLVRLVKGYEIPGKTLKPVSLSTHTCICSPLIVNLSVTV